MGFYVGGGSYFWSFLLLRGGVAPHYGKGLLVLQEGFSKYVEPRSRSGGALNTNTVQLKLGG